MPTILGANSATGAYEISNSVRFDDGSSDRLYFDQGSGDDTTARRKWTFSTWVKRSEITSSNHEYFFGVGDYTLIGFRKDDSGEADDLYVQSQNSGTATALQTNAKFRDPHAWYHIFAVFDSTQGTASNRLKVYVNGNEVGSEYGGFSVDQTGSITQNEHDLEVGDSGTRISIAYSPNGTSSFYDGYMAETHLLIGTAKAYTDFGETNDNGVWVPKETSFATSDYGSNGFKLEYKQTGTSANSSGIGADTSGNDNHFTVQNLDAQNVTEDTPTNNFATFSGIAFGGGGLTDYTSRLSNGNLVGDTTNNSDDFTYLSIFPTNMPFYYEMKFEDVHSSGNDQRVGIVRVEKSSQGGSHATAEYRNDGGIYSFNSAGGNVASSNTGNQSFSDGDIIGVAADNTTNNNVKFYHNGTLQATIAIDSSETYMPFVRLYGSSTTTRVSANFGNPVFSISSPQSDDNGYGTFEYDVPSGYYALCTKNLAEFG